MNKPQLWIVAGPNGSGKSTLVEIYSKYLTKINFINPDEIARQIEPNNPTHPSLVTQLQAGKQAILLQKQYLKARQSFRIETTFSGNREINLMKEAKELGYKVNLIFVGLNDPKYNLDRVNERVNKGGHFVSPEDIVRRYSKSFDNLNNNYKLADRLYLFDNNSKKHRLVLSMEHKKLKRLSKELPNWSKSIVQEIAKKQSKDYEYER